MSALIAAHRQSPSVNGSDSDSDDGSYYSGYDSSQGSEYEDGFEGKRTNTRKTSKGKDRPTEAPASSNLSRRDLMDNNDALDGEGKIIWRHLPSTTSMSSYLNTSEFPTQMDVRPSKL